jgi:4-aminobutyrate aminotransferase-like enzyme
MSLYFMRRAHEAWNLPTPPDFVTFAKKMQLGGFFYRASARPKEVNIESDDGL